MKKLTRDETEHGQHYYSAAEVDALLAQPQPIGEGFFLPDGTFSGSASKRIGRLRPAAEDAAAGCTIRLLYTTPPQRQPLTPEKQGYVPLSDDGKSVFIDGFGEVPLAYPSMQPPLPVQEQLAKVNRYCSAGMCVETDDRHETFCFRHISQVAAQQDPVDTFEVFETWAKDEGITVWTSETKQCMRPLAGAAWAAWQAAAQFRRQPLTAEQTRVDIGLERVPGNSIMCDVRRIKAAHNIKE